MAAEGGTPRLKEGELPEDLRRGVSLSQLLWRFGTVLRYMPTTLPLDERIALYEKSRQVPGYCAFLSHCWKSSGVQKYIALMLYFMDTWSILAGIGAALIVALGQAWFGQLPSIGLRQVNGIKETWQQSPWETLAGVSVSMVVLFIVPIVRQRTFLFLDCACINQTSSERVLQGVRCLAGFLQASKTLLILWDELYFTRGWCVYEVALYKSQNPQGQIRIVPIRLTSIMFCLKMYYNFSCVGFLFSLIGPPKHPLSQPTISLLIVSQLMAVTAWFAEDMVMRIEELDDQFKSFDVLKAEVAEESDREAILQSIGTHFGSIEHFNHYVRTTLKEDITGEFNKQLAPVNYRLAFGASWTFVPLFIGCVASSWGKAPWAYILTTSIYFVALCFFACPALLGTTFTLARRWGLRERSASSCSFGARHALIGLVSGVLSFANDAIAGILAVGLAAGELGTKNTTWFAPLVTLAILIFWIVVSYVLFYPESSHQVPSSPRVLRAYESQECTEPLMKQGSDEDLNLLNREL